MAEKSRWPSRVARERKSERERTERTVRRWPGISPRVPENQKKFPLLSSGSTKHLSGEKGKEPHERPPPLALFSLLCCRLFCLPYDSSDDGDARYSYSPHTADCMREERQGSKGEDERNRFEIASKQDEGKQFFMVLTECIASTPCLTFLSPFWSSESCRSEK